MRSKPPRFAVLSQPENQGDGSIATEEILRIEMPPTSGVVFDVDTVLTREPSILEAGQVQAPAKIGIE